MADQVSWDSRAPLLDVSAKQSFNPACNQIQRLHGALVDAIDSRVHVC